MTNVVNLYGAQSAELAASGFIMQTHDVYSAELTARGVLFPDAELRQTKLEYDAWAAQQRGSHMLSPDGSPIEVPGNFNCEAAGAFLYAGRIALQNADRLTSLCDMALTAHAGKLAVNQYRQMDTLDDDDVAQFCALNKQYKHFVQAGIAVEEWGEPWADLVADTFPGAPLAFPLDKSSVTYASTVLSSTYFTVMRHRHFATIDYLWLNFGNSLGAFDRGDPYFSGYGKLVTSLALFYRSSPTAVDAALSGFIAGRQLPEVGDWHQRVHEAAKVAANLFFAHEPS